MRTLIAILFSLFIATGIISCCKEETAFPTDYEYLIFGAIQCRCIDDCSRVYKISNGMLFDGVGIGCLVEDYTFPTPLSAEKYTLAYQLIEEFPSKLLKSDEDRYGCPGCVDQGIYYLELKSGDTHRIWNIDSIDDDLPDFLKPYQDLMEEVFDGLI